MRVEFRDGEQEISDYLADLMVGLDTYRMTKEEAIKAANDKMMARHVNKAMDRIISDHMQRLGTSR
jgi:hypothetical protein